MHEPDYFFTWKRRYQSIIVQSECMAGEYTSVWFYSREN